MSNVLGRRGLAYTASLGVGVAHRMLIGSGGGGNLSPGEELAYIIICIVLIFSSGIAAGLTLGLLSLDRVDLEVIKRTGTPKQVWMVSKVEPLIADPHWLLVSLLLLNSASYEALPLFLDRLLNPWAAIVISVSLILVIGEIAPQAVCKRYGLQIGAYSSWFVRILMWVTAPISWPLGKVLDWLLGEETALFRRAELRELVALHGEPDQDGGESMLTAEEVNVIHGAMDMAHKTAETAMTPIANVFALDANATLDRPLLQRIIAEGHSRVPVYEGHVKNIIGLILVKELVLVDITKNLRVRECLLRDVDFILASTPLYSVMELFRLKRRHMAVLTAGAEGSVHSAKPAAEGGDAGGEANGAAVHGAAEALLLNHGAAKEAAHRAHTPEVDVVGVITFEDCLEELFGMEILDESDLFVDNEQTERVPEAPRLPDKLLRYLSFDRKRKGPSARPSPSKQAKQDAIVAAAASAAYAAVKNQAKSEAKAGTDGTARRVKSAGVLHDLAAESHTPGEGIIELAPQEPQDDKPVRPASMLP